MSSVDPVPPGVYASQNTLGTGTSPISAMDWFSSTQLPSIGLDQASAQALTVTGNAGYYQSNVDLYSSVLNQYGFLLDEYLAAQYNVDAINAAAAAVDSTIPGYQAAQTAYNAQVAIMNTPPTPAQQYDIALAQYVLAIGTGNYGAAATILNNATTAYQSAVDDYNSAATAFNSAVSNYNNAIADYNAQILVANNQINSANGDRQNQGLPPLPIDAFFDPLDNSVVAPIIGNAPDPVPTSPPPPDPLPSPIPDPTLTPFNITPPSIGQVSTDVSTYTGGVITSIQSLSQVITTLGTLVEYIGSITPVKVRKIQPLSSGIVPDHISMAAAVMGLGNPNLQKSLSKNVLAAAALDVYGKQLGFNFEAFSNNFDRYLAGITVEVLSLLGSVTGLGIVGSITAGSSQGEINRALALGGAEEILRLINSGGLTTRLSGLIQNAFPDATPAQREQILAQLLGPVTYILGAVSTAYLEQATNSGASASQQYYQSFSQVRKDIDAALSSSAVQAQQTLNDVIKKNLTTANDQQVNTIREATLTAYARKEDITNAIISAYNRATNLQLDRAAANNIAFQSLKSLLNLQRSKEAAIKSAIVDDQAFADTIKEEARLNDEAIISNQINNLNEARSALQPELSSSVNESVRSSLIQNFVSAGSISREQAGELTKSLQSTLFNFLKQDQLGNLQTLEGQINQAFAKVGVAGNFGAQFLQNFTTALASRAGIPPNNYDIVNLLERYQKAVEEFRNHAEDIAINIIKSRNRELENAANEAFSDLAHEAESPSRVLVDLLDPGKLISKVGLMYEGMQGSSFKRGGTDLV